MQTIPTKYHKEQVTLLQNSPQLTPGLQIQLKVTKEVRHKFHLFQTRKNLQIKIALATAHTIKIYPAYILLFKKSKQ